MVAIVPDARFLLLLVLLEDNVILSHTAGTIKQVKCGGVRMGLSMVVCCWVLYSGGGQAGRRNEAHESETIEQKRSRYQVRIPLCHPLPPMVPNNYGGGGHQDESTGGVLESFVGGRIDDQC